MSGNEYVTHAGLQIDAALYQFVETEVLPGLSLSSDQIWSGFSDILARLGPTNQSLLAKRDQLQAQIDAWYQTQGGDFSPAAQEAFLREIGYLVSEGDDFSISTENVDPEIATIAGPQLVVPVMNARYALNAANARWGSLYDALYGTDVIEGEIKPGGYDPERGAAVMAYSAAFLDQALPLTSGKHADATAYQLADQDGQKILQVTLQDGQVVGLTNPEKFIGYRQVGDALHLLCRNHNLHIELVCDPAHPIGKHHQAGLADVILEAAITTIQDCEDSVAAVDAADKIAVYRNWLGLMKGDLQETFEKNGRSLTRKLAEDRFYQDVTGAEIRLSGRSLLLVRNVGHLMTIDVIKQSDGQNIPEGFLDGLITGLIALHDLSKPAESSCNSRAGSLYVVKPKMHGPEEAAFANDLFNAVEDLLGMARHTIKIGVMDEERRTTVNLKESIRAVQGRLVFINTGFLDRTGDEIHTSFLAGPMLRKDTMKTQPWLQAYENWNVDIGLSCGLNGIAQIGKGMWAMPDEMAQMMAQKSGHLTAGANCAWVPSPTAAVLHAMHYHQIDVFTRQAELKTRARAELSDILTIPVLSDAARQALTAEEIQQEIDNNVQGILGYVVRWINDGIGCSKVPNIHNVGLMEDRATLRISSQHLANWLHHGICDQDQVMDSFKRMAVIVDQQNKEDPAYQPMGGHFDTSVAFKAACDLVLKGKEQPSGYTEPILHEMRQLLKQQG